jgi:hypothetical protein
VKPLRPFLAALILAGTPALAYAQGSLALKHAPAPTAPAITSADLITRLYILADDSMLGRRAGELGNLKATAYIEAEARRLGLEPAGDGGGYFQNVPLVRRTLAERSWLAAGGQRLQLWTDYTPLPARGDRRPLQGARVIYGGAIDDVRISREQAAGQLVLLRSAAGLAGLGRLRIPPTSPLQAAAGVAIVADQPLPEAMIQRLHEPSLTLPSSGEVVPGVLLVTAHAADVLLGAPFADAQPGVTGKTITGQLAYDDVPAPTRNVVGIVRGTDPQLRGEYVALSAHTDHLGAGAALDHDSIRGWNMVMRPAGADSRVTGPPTPEQAARITALLDSIRRVQPDRRDSIFNGADDDGSGTVSLLEIAQAFAAGPAPKRSLLFVWHTGEELGLLGSRWFSEHPTVPRDSIVADLNMDMVGRGAAADLPNGGPRYLQLVGSHRLSTELGDLVEKVNAGEPQPFTFDYQYDANGHPQNIYCRSDHAMYARYGIPVTFFTTGLHEDYHQLTDEPEYIDYEHMARVAQLVHDVAARVGDLDHRPVVDKPKPDPTAPCRQ